MSHTLMMKRWQDPPTQHDSGVPPMTWVPDAQSAEMYEVQLNEPDLLRAILVNRTRLALTSRISAFTCSPADPNGRQPTYTVR